MEKFEQNLKDAIRSLQIADHMAYVTFPLVSEQRLLLKIFDEIYKSIINCINAILNYEYLYKRIKLYTSNGDNFQTFVQKCAKNYNLSNQQIKIIGEIIEINRKHKQSAIEFVKRDRVVIMSDNISIQTLDIFRVKQYLILTKDLIMKINQKINS